MDKTWLKAAGIRALKTFAQTLVATIGTTAVLEQVNWPVVLSTAILAGILSIATSVAGLPEVATDGVFTRDDDDRSDDAPDYGEEEE